MCMAIEKLYLGHEDSCGCRKAMFGTRGLYVCGYRKAMLGTRG